MLAKAVDLAVGLDGKQRITFQVEGDARAFFQSHRDKPVELTAKQPRKKRSLDANAYFHVLVNKIATTLCSSDEEVKKHLVVKYGTLETDEDGSVYSAMLPASADIDRLYPYTRCYKTVEHNGKHCKCYLFYKRTRDMDSKEMSHLIDGTVSEAKALDIETATPAEIERYKEEWRA